MHFVVMRVVGGAVCRQEDVFFVSMTSLGTLQRLVVGHDGVGHGAGWYLDQVTVREHGDEAVGKEFVFPCHRWLDDHEDDGRTERELLVAGDLSPPPLLATVLFLSPFVCSSLHFA